MSDEAEVRDIRLEFLRPGPAHNQLLSPLTAYMALCGADGPVSVHLPFEHAQLLTRLNRLRYEIDGTPIATSQRAAELQELGEAIARVLGEIPELVSELRTARGDTSRLLNIRLLISAFELGLVPFEATMSPADTSGSGAPLLLRTLTNITREIRRARPLQSQWNRAPRILFAFASPPGFAAVPAQSHLEALRRAIDPWIKAGDTPAERLVEVRRMLTVLPNATTRSISDACQAEDYTHVHLLAHGAPLPGSDRRFGIVLCKEGDADDPVVVDGQSLAIALKSMNSDGRAKQPPTLVSLATCDSGNAGSVLTPGGSIAHELHAQDIPWVIASQFPLWMRASNIATEILYSGLLAGNDPRWVVHELRQRLRIDLPDTHDWASIVAYAAVTPDLESQVDAFRSRQTKSKMEAMLDRMDSLVRAKSISAEAAAELDRLCHRIRIDLAAWRDRPAAQRNPREKAERLGMSAASEKRIAIVYALAGDSAGSAEAYRQSREFYEASLRIEPANHWAMTQFLSLAATPALAPDEGTLAALRAGYGKWWLVAWQLAQWQLRSACIADRVWAHSTLAELELLGTVYGGDDFEPQAARDRIAGHCRQVRELSEEPFPIRSTQRQFRRYVDHWPRSQWEALALAALGTLEGCKA